MLVEQGARRLVGFVPEHNIKSMTGSKLTGHRPVSIRTIKWRLLHRTISFGPLPDDLKRKFDQLPTSPPAGTRREA